MKEIKSLQEKIPLGQKLILVLFGLFLSFVLLEVSLRISGFVLLSLQEYRNSLSIIHKGAYRILCLGESTTQNQYPAFLEQILNERNIGVKFSVIDGGRGGLDTGFITSQLSANLDKYHPDMVVVMMGINDYRSHMSYKATSYSNRSRIMDFFRSFRTYKLAKLIWLHLVATLNEREIFHFKINRLLFTLESAYAVENKATSAEGSLKKALELNPGNDTAYIELGWLYYNQGNLPQAEDSFKKALELNPENYTVYVGLGWLYRDRGDLLQAENSLKKALELNPKKDNAYIELGWFYCGQGDIFQAISSFKKALEFNPANDNAYIELGWIYCNRGDLLQAISSFKKALEFNPANDKACVGLGRFYHFKGDFPQAEGSLKKALELNPGNDTAYIELGWLYYDQGNLPQAEDSFKKALALNPHNDSYQGALSTIYYEIGNYKLFKDCFTKANQLRIEYYTPFTVNNYRKLKEIIDKRGICLVCVQYPMRSVESLKNIFKDQHGIVFVDNEKLFKKAVKKSGYREYFTDMFAGDFGHCTSKGNRLLAENIANAILKEVFHK